MPLHAGCQLVFMLEESKVVLLNCFELIEARLWYDLCWSYYHIYGPPRNGFRNLCQGYSPSKLLVSCVFSECWITSLRSYTPFRKVAGFWGPKEVTLESGLAHN
jgi:hypothetical protein